MPIIGKASTHVQTKVCNCIIFNILQLLGVIILDIYYNSTNNENRCTCTFYDDACLK